MRGPGGSGALDLSLEETTATEPRSIRWKTADGARVQAWLVEKGPGRSAVQFQHRKLPDQESAEAEKVRWGERVARLRELAEAE